VRSRIEAFITSPPDIRRLVEQLELLTHTRSREPYRVLVVNGSYDEGLRISLGLQQGGINVELAVQPDEALKQLVDFQPELLLVDVELPEVTGPELAAVVRQSEAYLHLPIVFLCEGASLRSQLEIMRSGADDLITDPVDLEAMLGVVQFHAQRARSVRYFASHDSLTGVLNHTEFMQRFEAQFEHASRHQQSFTYAHIDIDDLQDINDRHGYLTGDAVVKSLASLLSQRLRRSDIIGRYGGEELGVALPGTGVAAARRVLDEVRALFAELPHQVTGGSFFATFSCGVAGTPGYEVSVELHEAARKASRLAHEQGGNRVLLPRG
jgi:diguanylate cyclase (GGDEF)-like protein